VSPMPPGYNQPVGQPSYDGAEWGRKTSTTEGLGKGTHGCHHPAPPLCRIAGKPTDERGQLEAT